MSVYDSEISSLLEHRICLYCWLCPLEHMMANVMWYRLLETHSEFGNNNLASLSGNTQGHDFTYGVSLIVVSCLENSSLSTHSSCETPRFDSPLGHRIYLDCQFDLLLHLLHAKNNICILFNFFCQKCLCIINQDPTYQNLAMSTPLQ